MYSRHPQIVLRATPSFKTQVIVLSMDCRLLQVTDGAGDLARRVDQGPGQVLRQAPMTRLPRPLMEVFHTVLAALEKHIAAEIWSPFEVDHLADSMDGIVRLRGFGIPDRLDANSHAWSSRFKACPAVRRCKPTSYSLKRGQSPLKGLST